MKVRLAILTVLLGLQPLVAWGDTVRTAYVLATFPDSPAPSNETLLRTIDVAAQIDAYYAEQSYGQFTPQSDVFGIFTIERPPAGLATLDTRALIASEAQAALVTAGVSVTPYGQHFVYITPSANIGAAGIGLSSGVWIATAPWLAAPSFHLAAHELGHHYENWNHGHSYWCDGGLVNGSCALNDQGDGFSVMGGGSGHVSAAKKAQAGWLTPLTITSSGDYLLAPYELSGGVKALSVVGGTNRAPVTYQLEYRTSTGFDTSDPPFAGVVVHWVNGTESYLLDVVPPNVAFPIGQRVCLGSALGVTVMSQSMAGAAVRVDMRRCR